MDNAYLDRIKVATSSLLDDVALLDEQMMTDPTGLPGWDRAMLVTHLAANADGVRRAVEAARRDEVGEVYIGGSAGRAAEIQAGKGSPAAMLLRKLVGAAELLDAALAAADDDVWHRRALSHRGEVEIGPGLVVARLREVLVHHVDLQVGYQPRDWPSGWVMEEMDRSMLDLPSRLPGGLAVVLEATDVGQRWVSGNGDEVDLTGTSAELLAWVTGRATGVPGHEWPVLAPWR